MRNRAKWAVLVVAGVLAAILACGTAQAQRSVGACPEVIIVPAQQYYWPSTVALAPTVVVAQPLVPASAVVMPGPTTVVQPLAPVVAPQTNVFVGGYQPTVFIVLPNDQPPAPSPFGARYDRDGRLVSISTPQFDTSSPSALNSYYRYDKNGRLIAISTPQGFSRSGVSAGPTVTGRPCGAASFFGSTSFGE